MAAMSELSREHWAVISERGVEATGLTYDDAVILRRDLDAEKIYGLCIVTDAAAERDDARVSRPKSQVPSQKRVTKKVS
ncbi:MAG: hypothetical protein JOZ52_07430 [Acidobacteria bacterium]|nr:hypothetical protein [Acidobacteriota bacterium]